MRIALAALMGPKDPLPYSLRSDVVYRVDCKWCNAYNVGVAEYANIKEQSGEERPPFLILLIRTLIPSLVTTVKLLY